MARLGRGHYTQASHHRKGYTTMAQDVWIRTGKEPVSDDHPNGVLPGQVVEISLANANRLYPNAKVLHNADGTPYQKPSSKPSKAPEKATPVTVDEKADSPDGKKE